MYSYSGSGRSQCGSPSVSVGLDFCFSQFARYSSRNGQSWGVRAIRCGEQPYLQTLVSVSEGADSATPTTLSGTPCFSTTSFAAHVRQKLPRGASHAVSEGWGSAGSQGSKSLSASS